MSRRARGQRQQRARRPGSRQDLAIVALSLLGMAIAAYLWYAYAQGGALLCEPGSGCQLLEVSPYALLAGLPVALWGLLTYAFTCLAALMELRASGQGAVWLRLSLFGLALCGWLFSVYLQGIAHFAVGAFCPWCLVSALVMTAMLVLAVGGLSIITTSAR